MRGGRAWIAARGPAPGPAAGWRGRDGTGARPAAGRSPGLPRYPQSMPDGTPGCARRETEPEGDRADRDCVELLQELRAAPEGTEGTEASEATDGAGWRWSGGTRGRRAAARSPDPVARPGLPRAGPLARRARSPVLRE
ncbi:hypothetical protein SSP531S_06670 [Streptomyces spongiicola]|uniref:Uncharacterized protein n=1 Tax=Streptomyces spongiicola TaxID=1690221 RepID=A0A388SRL3_9ACTN|nr:hypothetical protein SSP531S_06670 [Streptomyces spongiicola]